ncbi:MAG: hypothetical protein ACE5Q6_13495 [Dehalococcoidia bacterium]
MPGRVFLANVGANASHRFQSPIFADGSFEMLPIPEAENRPGQSLVRFGDLKSFNHPEESLREFLPSRWWDWPCHFDPEFNTFTYGDDCEVAPRAAALKGLGPGDYLFFVARLVDYREGAFTGPPGFYLTGFLAVAEALRSVTELPAPPQMARFGANAHIRRAIADGELWNRFWVFRGSDHSCRFRRAVPVTRELAGRVFRTAQGAAWTWDERRSDLQIIGSYTRSCRCVIDPEQPTGRERALVLWRAVAASAGREALPPSVQADLGAV